MLRITFSDCIINDRECYAYVDESRFEHVVSVVRTDRPISNRYSENIQISKVYLCTTNKCVHFFLLLFDASEGNIYWLCVCNSPQLSSAIASPQKCSFSSHPRWIAFAFFASSSFELRAVSVFVSMVGISLAVIQPRFFDCLVIWAAWFTLLWIAAFFLSHFWCSQLAKLESVHFIGSIWSHSLTHSLSLSSHFHSMRISLSMSLGFLFSIIWFSKMRSVCAFLLLLLFCVLHVAHWVALPVFGVCFCFSRRHRLPASLLAVSYCTYPHGT